MFWKRFTLAPIADIRNYELSEGFALQLLHVILTGLQPGAQSATHPFNRFNGFRSFEKNRFLENTFQLSQRLNR